MIHADVEDEFWWFNSSVASTMIMKLKLICLPKRFYETDEDLSQSHEIIDANSQTAMLSWEKQTFCQLSSWTWAQSKVQTSLGDILKSDMENDSKRNDLHKWFLKCHSALNRREKDLMSSKIFEKINKRDSSFHISFGFLQNVIRHLQSWVMRWKWKSKLIDMFNFASHTVQ